MLRLVYLDLRGCFRLQIIWVVGTKQKAAGIYCSSRGCFTDGIASSGSIFYFVTLNEKSFERSASLLPCVQKYIGVNKIELLTAEGCFEEYNGMKGGKKNNDDIWSQH